MGPGRGRVGASLGSEAWRTRDLRVKVFLNKPEEKYVMVTIQLLVEQEDIGTTIGHKSSF